MMVFRAWACCCLAAGLAAAEEPAPPFNKVRHEPATPKPGDAMLVTARMAAGLREPALLLQTVAPGQYLRKTDPAYAKAWRRLPMRDDGQEGDAQAGDGVWSVRVPGAQQRHRTLLRYRLEARDAKGKPALAPKATDECPNFAWWCDAGLAGWSGAREPGKTPKLDCPPAFLATLQALTLIAHPEDVARSQWDGNYHKRKFPGTLVYRGVAYDHIQFSNRGQGSAHISGKNKWGLKFCKGHDVPFVDHAGVPFPDELDTLDLNPGGSTPYLPVFRGIGGLDEVMSMRAYRLAGVPSPPATWVQFRVVDGAAEADPKNQYEGDLWGLYVALGELEPKQLSDPPRRLPDGLVVSTQSGVKHAPKEGVPDPGKEWEKFLNGMRRNESEAWWRKHLDLPAYCSFHAMNRLLGNVDLRPDGNHGYYRHPDGRWAPIPWDNDMMFVPRHHQPGYIEAVRCLEHKTIQLEYRNRAREILDLFAADADPRGGQVGQLVADLGGALAPAGHQASWPRLDEALWNQHPRMNQKGSYYVNPMDGDHFGGRWKRTLATNDFAGMQRYLVEFCTDSRPTKNYAPNDGDQRGYGWGYLAHEAKDDKIPATPKLTSLHDLNDGFARFQASAFSSPAGHRPAALEWRVGVVAPRGAGFPLRYELAEHWRKEQEPPAAGAIAIPHDVLKERDRCRVRARWRDQTGRCGHWSAPLETSVR